MTEPTPEHGTEQPSSEIPIPKLETPSSGGSPSGVDTDAIVKQVTENLRRELRQAQSTKDKEIAAIKKTLKISDLSELEDMGVPIPDNVKLEYRLRQIEGGRTTEDSQSQRTPSPGNGAALTADEVSQAVQKFKLNANDTDVIEKLRGTYRNRDHFEATLAQMALARATKPTPTPAASTAMQTPPPSGSKLSEEEADKKYGELGALLKNPSTNSGKISQLKKELKESGYEVD